MRNTNEDFEVTIWSDVDVPKFLGSGYHLQMLPESFQCFPMKHHWTATLMYVKLMAMWCKIMATDHESEMYYSDMFFAQLFNAEAVECGLCDTLFSPVRFESFLAQNSIQSGSVERDCANPRDPIAGSSVS
jgi:hypothetical protein